MFCHATPQQGYNIFRDKCALDYWKRSTVNYFKIFKSLNFEGVQDVKLNRKERLIESNISDKMLDG